MNQKKPIWTTTEAHERLKSYCQSAGRTQLEVVSDLILNHLTTEGQYLDGVEPVLSNNKHFGGVWVV